MKQSTKLTLKLFTMIPFQFIWTSIMMLIVQPLIVILYWRLKRQIEIHSTLREFLHATNMGIINRIVFNLMSNFQTIEEVRTAEINGLI